MAKQPETKFKEKVKRELDKFGGKVWYFKSHEVSIRGIPDIIMCVNGKFVTWELKVPPNKVKKDSLQYYTLVKIAESNGVASEVTPNNLKEHLERIESML